MEIEKQVVFFELAKKLKDAGYPQDGGIWYWIDDYATWVLTHKGEFEIAESEGDCRRIDNWSECPPYPSVKNCVAPTVAELGEKLPQKIETDDEYSLAIFKMPNGKWDISYENEEQNVCWEEREADTEANCRAKMWLYLKDKKLL